MDTKINSAVFKGQQNYNYSLYYVKKTDKKLYNILQNTWLGCFSDSMRDQFARQIKS